MKGPSGFTKWIRISLSVALPSRNSISLRTFGKILLETSEGTLP